MGIKKLTVENAQIKTASVEVKTLTISGKQVTLAVFRQLPERSVITWDGDRPIGLRGKVWGRVNYHPDKCANDRAEHIHVVWQDEDTLYRDYVHVHYLEKLKQKHPTTYRIVRDADDLPDKLISRNWNGFDSDAPSLHIEEWAEKYWDLVEKIDNIDQLFIAV